MARTEDGTSFSGHERNHLFLQSPGAKKPFKDYQAISGLDHPGDARVSVRFDFDRDGWLDFAIVNANAPRLQLFRNRMGEFADLAPRSGIGVRLIGGNHARGASEDGWSARDAYGARVQVLVGDRVIVREWRCGEGMGAQNGTTLWIGVGEAEQIDGLRVVWPSGRVSNLGALKTDRLVTVWENPEQGPQGRQLRVVQYHRDSDAEPVTHAAERRYAPAFAAESTSSLRVYMSMATHCAACRRELPAIAAVRELFDEDDVALFGIPIDGNEARDTLTGYVERFSPAYDLQVDATDAQRATFEELVLPVTHVEVRPTTVVTDAEGNVLLIKTGPPTGSDLRRLLALQG